MADKPHLVVLTGAGISAESGIRTFRDGDGLWMGYDVYEVASPRGWAKNQSLVLDFYNARRRDIAAAQPNAAHRGIAELEENFRVTVITQNIDDLHERAGSTTVLHLHGEIFKMRSEKAEYPVFETRGDIKAGDLAPDGAQLRPHIVWFDEPVPLIEVAADLVTAADIFVIVGTSLQVYPAAGLMDYTLPGIPRYIIDKSIPGLAARDIIKIEAPASEGVASLKKMLGY